jgi:hypothetical protein
MKEPAAYRRLAAMGSPADHGSATTESPIGLEKATTTPTDPTKLEISVDKGRAAELKMVTLMKPYHHDTCVFKSQLAFLSKTLSQMCSIVEPRHTAKGKLIWAKKDQLLKVRERLVDLTEARTKGMQAKSISDMPAVQELMMLTAGKVKSYLAVSRQGMMREIKKGLTPEIRDQIQWKDFGALATEKWDDLTTQIKMVIQQIEANKQQLDADLKAVVEVFGLLEVKSEPVSTHLPLEKRTWN